MRECRFVAGCAESFWMKGLYNSEAEIIRKTGKEYWNIVVGVWY